MKQNILNVRLSEDWLSFFDILTAQFPHLNRSMVVRRLLIFMATHMSYSEIMQIVQGGWLVDHRGRLILEFDDGPTEIISANRVDVDNLSK